MCNTHGTEIKISSKICVIFVAVDYGSSLAYSIMGNYTDEKYCLSDAMDHIIIPVPFQSNWFVTHWWIRQFDIRRKWHTKVWRSFDFWGMSITHLRSVGTYILTKEFLKLHNTINRRHSGGYRSPTILLNVNEFVINTYHEKNFKIPANLKYHHLNTTLKLILIDTRPIQRNVYVLTSGWNGWKSNRLF